MYLNTELKIFRCTGSDGSLRRLDVGVGAWEKFFRTDGCWMSISKTVFKYELPQKAHSSKARVSSVWHFTFVSPQYNNDMNFARESNCFCIVR